MIGSPVILYTEAPTIAGRVRVDLPISFYVSVSDPKTAQYKLDDLASSLVPDALLEYTATNCDRLTLVSTVYDRSDSLVAAVLTVRLYTQLLNNL